MYHITSATAKWTFSAFRRHFTNLHSIMPEKWLNYCLILHVHNEFTGSFDLISVAKEFVSPYDVCRKYFGSYG